MPAPSIPSLRLSDFHAGGEAEARFISNAGDALADVGFYILTDHGVDAELIRRAYAAAETFFTLPEVEKRRCEVPDSKGQRGFTRFGQEHAKGSAAPDLKEFWHVGREVPGVAASANIWPQRPDDFQAAFTALYQALDRCAASLLEATALYLDEPRRLMADAAENGGTILRIIHYPPVPADAHPDSLRAAPHEDINLITLLCGATAGGLEILTREGEWLAVEAGPGEIIVDAGDMLQSWTNGLLRSTTHRVANPDNGRERRFSMPFFVHPHAETRLDPLPSCVARTGETPHYPALTAGDYLAQRLREIGLA